MSLIDIIDLKKNYKMGKVEVEALKCVNLQVNKGEFLAIAGSSGSGKSTLLNLIGCLDYPTSGSIRINEQKVEKMLEMEIDRLRLNTIGFIFQTFNLISVLNILENIEMPLLIMPHISKGERKDRIEYFLEAVGLKDQKKKRPAELSGGQRQRVAIARALVTHPQIVLADEPTANLDSKTGIEIIELMHDICLKEKTTFIFSTHDSKVMNRADKVVYIQDGVIKESNE